MRYLKHVLPYPSAVTSSSLMGDGSEPWVDTLSSPGEWRKQHFVFFIYSFNLQNVVTWVPPLDFDYTAYDLSRAYVLMTMARVFCISYCFILGPVLLIK